MHFSCYLWSLGPFGPPELVQCVLSYKEFTSSSRRHNRTSIFIQKSCLLLVIRQKGGLKHFHNAQIQRPNHLFQSL